MTRIRLIMLSLLAVFAVGAVASASASAACSAEGGDTAPLYCLNNEKDGQIGTTGLDEGGGEAEFHSAGTTVFTLTAGTIVIECKKETDSGKIFQQDSKICRNSDVEVVFTECIVKGFPKCIVQDSVNKKAGTIIVGPEIDSELKANAGKIYDVLFPSGGETEPFVTLEILKKGTETCLVPEGQYPVTGEACGETNSEQKVKSPLTFSKTIEEACKAAKPLMLKKVAAFLNGTSTQELVGEAEVENELTGKLEKIKVTGLTWGT